MYIHSIFGNFAIICKNFHTCFLSLPKCLAKRFICGVVGIEVLDPLHLDHKKYISPEAAFRKTCQLPQMYGAPFRRRVRKSADAVIFQCHTLHFQKAGLSTLLKIKVKAGISVLTFRF